jgi:hypothetical protein
MDTTNETTEKRTLQCTMSDTEVRNLVEQAVQYGVSKTNAKNAIAIEFGSIWLDGYIAANKMLTEDDIASIRLTIKNYYFF